MRKLVLLMTAFLLLIGLQARAADVYVQTSAPDQVYVYGFNGASFGENNGAWPGAKLTDIVQQPDESGYYHFIVPNGAAIIFHNGSGAQTGNIEGLQGNNYFIYPYNDSYSQYHRIISSYTIFGPSTVLFGTEWDATNTANDMTEDNGIWTLEKPNVELTAGDYQYKVAGDHSVNAFVYPTGDPQSFNIAKAGKYNVSFTFNPATNELNATAEEVVVPITSYTIVGDPALGGWDATNTDNDMTENEGVWTLTKTNVELNAGTYNYKVVGNQDPAVYEKTGTLTVPKHAIYDVTFTFNPETEELSAQAVVAQRIYVLRYGPAGTTDGWANVNFDNNLQKTLTFSANTEFVIYDGKDWYGVGGNNVADYFNTDFELVTGDSKKNIHINGAGEYTIALTVDDNGDAASINVQGFAAPKYFLKHGVAGQNWDEGELFSLKNGRLEATVADFPAGNAFKVYYDYDSNWYGAGANTNNVVDYFSCTNLALATGDTPNFIINEDGTYTFILTVSDNKGIPTSISIEGFTKPAYELKYGENGTATFAADDEGKLVATVSQFPANTDFLVKFGRYEYGAGTQDDPLVDYFHNAGIELKAEGKQNFHINEAGTYTFVLTLDQENNEYPASISVQGFAKPDYKLSYGAAGAQNWTGLKTFTSSGEEGKLVVSNVEFSANDEFVITYGRYKYSSNAEGDFWLVDRQNCTNLSLIRDGKNFRFDEAGTYTFEMILDENEFPATLNITGFTPPAYKLSYGVPNETWNEMTFEEDESGKLVATVNSFPANNEFLVIYCEGNKKVYYGAAPNADNLVDYFNPNITLVTEGHQNLHITEGGNYTFVLTLNDQGYPASISVSEFTEPNYVLSYGQANQDWTDVPFTNSEGKITAADVQFPANTEFLIKYGRYTYGGATGERVYKIHSEWCTDIGITDTGYKPFLIEDAGTYTFEITITSNDEGVSKSITVTGWPEPVVIESYTVAGTKELLGTEEDWAIVEANDMTVDNGIWTLVKENVELEPGVTYEYKVAGNHDFATWVFPADHNKTLTVDKHGLYKVTFTLNPETPELTAVVELTQEILPDYVLHYGKGNNWQTKTFVNGTSTYQGKLVVTGLVFEQYTEFGVKYGNTWYGGFSDQNYYDIHSNHHEGIVLSTGSNVKNFRIQEAGNYVIVLYTDPADSKLKIDVIYPIRGDVTGDGLVDTSDVNAVVNIILSKASQADYPGNANIVEEEGDPQGKVDVSDLNAIVNIILGKSIE